MSTRAAGEISFETDSSRLRPTHDNNENGNESPLTICQRESTPAGILPRSRFAAFSVLHQPLIVGPERHRRGPGPSDPAGNLPKRVVGERPSVVPGHGVACGFAVGVEA